MTRELLDQLMDQIADLMDEGRPHEAVPLVTKLCKMAGDQLGARSLEYAEALSTAGEVSREVCEIDQAREQYLLALDIVRAVCGEQDVRYAEALEELAVLEYDDAEYEQALEYRWQALAIQRTVLGDDHPACIGAIRKLMELCELTGDERTDYLEGLLGGNAVAPDADADPVLECQVADLNRQVVALWNQQSFRDALTVARRAVAMARGLGPTHVYFGASLVNLANLEQTFGDRTRCEALFKEAIEVRRAALGADHPQFAVALSALAEFYRDGGRHADAETLYRRGLAIQRVAGDPADLLVTLNGLGLLLDEMHRYAESEPLLTEALQVCLNAGMENAPEHAMCLNNLAMLLSSKGEPRRAMPLYRDALDVMRKSTGRRSPQYAVTLNNLALLHKERDELAEAEQLYQESLELKREIYGDDHAETAFIMHNLGQLRRAMGDTRQARELFQQALEIQRRTLGENHPSVAMTLESIAGLYHDDGQGFAGEVNLQQALDIKRSTYGEDHAETRRTKEKLSGSAEAERRCLQAFIDRDYDACVVQVVEHTRITNRTNPMMAYLALLGMQRQGLDDLVRNNAARVAHVLASHPWELFLLRVVLGEAGLQDVSEPITDSHRRCQLHYYRGARLLTEGRRQEAEAEFADCLACDVQCAERACAMADQSYPGLPHVESSPARDEVHRLNDQAQQAQQEGGMDEALRLAREATDLARRTLDEDDTALARSLCNEAVSLRDLGDFAAAETLLLSAQAIYRRHYGPSHTVCGIVRQNLAAIYFDQARYAESRPLLEEGLEMERRTHGEETLEYGMILRNLATSCSMTGELTRAERLFDQASQIFAKQLGTASEPLADCLTDWGRMYAAAGSLDLAEQQLSQAISVARQACGERHRAFAAAQTVMANLLIQRQRPAEAEQLLLPVLAFRRETLGDYHEFTGATLNHLGVACQAQGEFEAALEYQQQAAQISAHVKGEEHSDHAAALFGLAVAQAACGRPREALQLMQQAAAIDERMIGQVFGLAAADARLAYTQQLGALTHFLLSLVVGPLKVDDLAVTVALNLVLHRKALAAEGLAAQRDAIFGERYPHLREKFRELGELRQELARATLSGSGLASVFIGQPPVATILASLSQLGGLVGQVLKAAPRQRLVELQQRVERIESELARQVVEMNLTQRLRAVDHGVVADRLPADSVLIEFVRFHVYNFQAVPARGEPQWSPSRYVAFTIPAGNSSGIQLIDLGEADSIDRLIRDFRAGIMREVENRAGRDLGAAPIELARAPGTSHGPALRASVFDKLVPALAGCKRLLLAPDGDLSRLPFEVLPMPDGRHLIEDYTISYVSCGRDVLRFGAASERAPAEPLVVADPNFDLNRDGILAESSDEPHGRRSRDLDRSSLRFGRLPGTRVEGDRISGMLGVQPWTEAAALEGRLKACRSPRILHLATHGFFLTDQKRDPNKEMRDLGAIGFSAGNGFGRLSGAGLENPLLRSGLALAGVNSWLKGGTPPEEAEDGLLTAEDVTGLDLLDTDLVVLSACETGLGEIQVGEGVFGLRRAFVLAGAKTLVMSLWKVPDQQTQELMEDFYRRILDGQPRAKALRDAQLTLKAKYPEPLYWGAFICQGDPGPLPQR